MHFELIVSLLPLSFLPLFLLMLTRTVITSSRRWYVRRI